MTDEKTISAERALKQALEALEFIPRSGSMLGSQAETKRLQAIAALREALKSVPDWASEAIEQPAPVAKPHEQEPVAWRVWRGDAYELFFSKYAADRRADCFTKRPDVEPLYTSPQAQRKPLTPEWYARWIRNNYQDHPNIATLCDEMTKAAHGIKENT